MIWPFFCIPFTQTASARSMSGGDFPLLLWIGDPPLSSKLSHFSLCRRVLETVLQVLVSQGRSRLKAVYKPAHLRSTPNLSPMSVCLTWGLSW